jgi:hypothetical protein
MDFRAYYKSHCAHTALGSNTPSEIPNKPANQCADLNNFQWTSHCRGLYQLASAA